MYYDMYYYGLEDMFGSMSEGTMIAVLLICMGVLLLMSVIGIVSYVLMSMSLCSIAGRRGIRGAGWAWMPFVGVDWVIGKIADTYDLRQTGRDKRFAKRLLVLSIVGIVLLMLVYLVFAVWMGVMIGLEGSGADTEALFLPMFLSIYVVLIAMMIIFTIAGIIEYVALFKVYESCNPEKAIRLLVLTILFGRLGLAICLASVRGKDLGYAEIEAREQEIAKRYLPAEPCTEEEPAEA